MQIGILTDSTADLDKKSIDKHNIHTIPLNIHFDEDKYLDKVDITPEQFFNKLQDIDSLPKTSQASLSAFINKYKEMAQEYDQIISIHLSEKLSGTINTAKMAAREVPDVDIYTIDSKSISLGLGFLVLLSAKLSKRAKKAADIVETLKVARDNLFLYFTVNELKYMEKGGRIGKASAFLGSILNINPIISISTATGEVLPIGKSRGETRTMKKMVKIALKKLQDSKYAWLGFAHGNREEDMLKFKSLLTSSIDKNIDINYKTFISRISPTLGCHVGPSVYAGFILTGNYLA